MVIRRHLPAIFVWYTDITKLWPDLITVAGSSAGLSPDEKQAGIPIESCMILY